MWCHTEEKKPQNRPVTRINDGIVHFFGKSQIFRDFFFSSYSNLMILFIRFCDRAGICDHSATAGNDLSVAGSGLQIVLASCQKYLVIVSTNTSLKNVSASLKISGDFFALAEKKCHLEKRSLASSSRRPLLLRT